MANCQTQTIMQSVDVGAETKQSFHLVAKQIQMATSSKSKIPNQKNHQEQIE